MNKQVKTINLAPSWKTAVVIYCDVLQNPKASAEAKKNARDDLLRLAEIVDRNKSDN